MTTFEKFGDPALGCEPYWYQGQEWEIVLLKQLQKLSEYTLFCYMFGSCKRIAQAFFCNFWGWHQLSSLAEFPTVSPSRAAVRLSVGLLRPFPRGLSAEVSRLCGSRSETSPRGADLLVVSKVMGVTPSSPPFSFGIFHDFFWPSSLTWVLPC